MPYIGEKKGIAKKLSSLQNKLIVQYDKYIKVKENVEAAIKPFVGFDFYIEYLPGDGHCVGNADSANVAPLGWCIGVIEQKGKLTAEDHKELCI